MGGGVMSELIGNPGGEWNIQAVNDRHDVVGNADGFVRHVRILHTYNFLAESEGCRAEMQQR